MLRAACFSLVEANEFRRERLDVARGAARRRAACACGDGAGEHERARGQTIRVAETEMNTAWPSLKLFSSIVVKFHPLNAGTSAARCVLSWGCVLVGGGGWMRGRRGLRIEGWRGLGRGLGELRVFVVVLGGVAPPQLTRVVLLGSW